MKQLSNADSFARMQDEEREFSRPEVELDDDIEVLVRKRLVEMRNGRGWTQADLSLLVKPKTSALEIFRLENGERRLTLRWLERLAQAFDVGIGFFLPDNHLDWRHSDRAEMLAHALSGVPEQDHQRLIETCQHIVHLAREISLENFDRATMPGDPVLTKRLTRLWAELTDAQRAGVLDLMAATKGIG